MYGTIFRKSQQSNATTNLPDLPNLSLIAEATAVGFATKTFPRCQRTVTEPRMILRVR